MSPIRRITGLLTGVLVLQLTLLGAISPCGDHGVSGIAAAGHEQSGQADPVSAAPAASGDHEDCDGGPGEPPRTGSSGGNCIAMISCVTPMLQLDTKLLVADGSVTTTQVAAAVLEPPTRSTAPELPPPRA